MMLDEEKRLTYFYESILELKNADEVRMFFEDICTDIELSAISQRLQVAKLLREGLIYSDIVKETSASTATISRVNRSLRKGAGGYKILFERKHENSPETEPEE